MRQGARYERAARGGSDPTSEASKFSGAAEGSLTMRRCAVALCRARWVPRVRSTAGQSGAVGRGLLRRRVERALGGLRVVQGRGGSGEVETLADLRSPLRVVVGEGGGNRRFEDGVLPVFLFSPRPSILPLSLSVVDIPPCCVEFPLHHPLTGLPAGVASRGHLLRIVLAQMTVA